MTNRLTIGIVRLRPGWRIILDQLGVAYEVIRRWEGVSPERYSAIIVDAAPDTPAREAIGAYLRDGGAVLDGGGYYLPAAEPRSFRRRFVRRVAADPGDDLFGGLWLAGAGATVRVHRDAGLMGGTVYLGRRGAGAIAHIPFDPGALAADTSAVRKQFPAPSRRLPDEIVAEVPKGELRRIAAIALRWLHTSRGLPYLHRWYFPERLPGIFCFRIDSDYGTPAQTAALHAVAREYGIRMTWFLHVEAHHGWLDRFAAMSDQEMALHGYRHRTFPGYEENLANITEAAALLRRAGIPFTGFAAPNGFWNPELSRAIADAGLLYSSEFSLDYDDLPFHPDLYGEKSPALQVPVHPVCIGSFLRAKAGPEQMKRYFREIIRRKFRAGEPVILYGHPGHEHWEVIADSFAYVRELGVENLTMGDYAAWWLRRAETRFEAFFDGAAVEVRFRGEHDAVRLALHDAVGRIAFIGGDGRWPLDAMEWGPPPAPPEPPPAEIGRVRRWSPTLLRHSIEDYNSRARQ